MLRRSRLWSSGAAATASPQVAMRALSATAVIAVGVLAPGCGSGGGDEARDGLEADTARFTYGDRSVEVPLADCGQEGDVIVLAGVEGAVVVQALADVGDGGAARSGVTADLGGTDGILGAFGADHENGPAGEIAAVGVDGDRVTIEGRWTTFDGELQPLPRSSAQLVPGTLEARCPETDEPTT